MTLLEGSIEVAKGSARRRQVALDIGDNVWMFELEVVGILIVVVATLGNGHGHNLGILVGHLVNDLGGAVRGIEERVDAANDACIAAVRGALKHSVQAVLAAQCIANASIKGLQADTTNGPFMRTMLPHQAIHVDSQVGPVKSTNANVYNTLLNIGTVERRELDVELVLLCGLGDRGQVLVGQVEACELSLKLGSGGVELLALAGSREGGIHGRAGAAFGPAASTIGRRRARDATQDGRHCCDGSERNEGEGTIGFGTTRSNLDLNKRQGARSKQQTVNKLNQLFWQPTEGV